MSPRFIVVMTLRALRLCDNVPTCQPRSSISWPRAISAVEATRLSESDLVPGRTGLLFWTCLAFARDRDWCVSSSRNCDTSAHHWTMWVDPLRAIRRGAHKAIPVLACTPTTGQERAIRALASMLGWLPAGFSMEHRQKVHLLFGQPIHTGEKAPCFYATTGILLCRRLKEEQNYGPQLVVLHCILQSIAEYQVHCTCPSRGPSGLRGRPLPVPLT